MNYNNKTKSKNSHNSVTGVITDNLKRLFVRGGAA